MSGDGTGKENERERGMEGVAVSVMTGELSMRTPGRKNV